VGSRALAVRYQRYESKSIVMIDFDSKKLGFSGIPFPKPFPDIIKYTGIKSPIKSTKSIEIAKF